MKIIALLPLFLGFSALAANVEWQDLRNDDAVVLAQPLRLDGKRGGSIQIRTGEPYYLSSTEPLPGLSVVDYIFEPRFCRIPGVESELTMVLPLGNHPKSEVGIYFLKGCRLEILVESKDLGTPSLFRRASLRRK